ncbi:MAG: hypothetical protein A2Y17_03975 [Clostridiales bacterium GWF2_38_85]|nr:MAG: hypothetical protein A2Y17_03975 [Clostridiales bacterium GWF2_38_85]HBL83954.1 hypothetical protein [Clostridiales bacterium]
MFKKLIAPIIITVITIIILISYSVVCFMIEFNLLVKVFGSIIPLALAGVAIFVLVERIKEIKGGEEDDLSKY